jgi:hypothetical protein
MDLKLAAAAAVAFLLQWNLIAYGADFNDIIKNPEKFHHKRVTFVAMATIGGDGFYLYESPEPKSPGDDPRVINGMLLRESPYYELYNHKRIRVTGVIDASYRGLVSENACGLTIERVRPIARPEKPRFSCDSASCLKVEFAKLLNSPGAYEHQCVCATGFAHVRGDAFVIYQSEKASGGSDPDSSTRDFKKGIFVSVQPSDTKDYDRYNNHWIKIKGIVDLSQRGFADYPAGIVAEEVQSASPEN